MRKAIQIEFETVQEVFSLNCVKVLFKQLLEEELITKKEYELLIYLIKNENIALTREQILANVWNYDFYGDDRTLDTHIKLLRKNLGIYGNCIVTIRGVGYRFEKNL